MADETEEKKAKKEERAAEHVEVDDVTDVAAEGSEAETSAVEEDRPDSTEWETPLVRRVRNRFTLGQLIVHYPERDVSVVIDGDSALRLIGVFAGHVPARELDRVHLAEATADNVWVGVSLEGVLAMSWIPGISNRPSRAVVDPPAPVGSDAGTDA